MKIQFASLAKIGMVLLLFGANTGYAQQESEEIQYLPFPIELTKIDASITFFEKTNEVKTLALLYEEKAKLLESQATYAAIAYYKKALEQYYIFDNREAIIRISNLIANFYYQLDDYENSLKENYVLLSFHEQNQDTIKIAQTHSTIGSLYSDLNERELAIKHQRMALKLCNQIGSERGIAAISNNIAQLYFDIDSIDQAFNCVRVAETINKKTNNHDWLSINRSQYADFYRELGQYDSARFYLDRVRDYTNEFGSIQDSIDLFRKTGIYYYYVDSVSEAVAYFNKGILLSRESGNIKSESNLNHWLSEVYGTKGEMDLALNYLTIHHDLLDSLANMQSKRRLEEYEILYGVGELERDLMASKYAEKIAQQNEDKIRSKFIFILCCGVLIFVIGFVIFIQYRKQIKTNRTLLKLNLASLESQSEDSQKYSNSNLSDDKKEAIQEAFIKLIIEEEGFKDQALNLEVVAKKLNVSRTYLSQVINETYDQNFNSFINECRVNLAKKYLLSPQYELYSIQGVAETVGFKSISSFNSAFKKNTGLTPSYYRNKGKK